MINNNGEWVKVNNNEVDLDQCTCSDDDSLDEDERGDPECEVHGIISLHDFNIKVHISRYGSAQKRRFFIGSDISGSASRTWDFDADDYEEGIEQVIDALETMMKRPEHFQPGWYETRERDANGYIKFNPSD